MKTLFARSLLSCLSVVALTCTASALVITPASPNVATGTETSQAQIDVIIAPLIAPSTLVYKQDEGGPESGSLAGSYTTVFDNTPDDPEDATITYNGGPFVQPTAYALVKDGNATPAWYLFNLTALGWNGTAILEFQDFWPTQGAISHVSLYGGGTTPPPPPPQTSVPDGGSAIALLGFALAALAYARRQFA